MPVRIVAKPVVTTPEAIAAVLARGRRRPGMRRRHRLDAHVLPGQDVDRRADRPAQAARPPPHAVQPRPAVGRHRHGLHEPQPGGPRRPGVRVHPDPPAARPQDGRRPLGGPGRHGPAGGLGPGGGRLARGAPPQGRPVRRQHAPGRGHRGRQGRGPGAARLLGQRLRRERPGRPGRRRRPTRPVDELVEAYEDAYDVAPALRRGGDRHAELRTAARIEAGLRGRSSRTAASARSPTRSRTSARSSSCRASASSG